jgi:predicted outer membrane protein
LRCAQSVAFRLRRSRPSRFGFAEAARRVRASPEPPVAFRLSPKPPGGGHAVLLIRVLSVTGLVLLVLCRSAGAQSSDSATPAPMPVETAAPVDGDRGEVAAIVMQSVSELKLCGLATQKSQNADVRSLCRKASVDSARTAIAGMQLAQTLGAREVKLQPAPDTPGLLDSLAQYSGKDFDREFLLTQIQTGAGDEQAIEYAAEVAIDAAVKSYENGVLPKLEDRVALAEGALSRISEAAP